MATNSLQRLCMFAVPGRPPDELGGPEILKQQI